MTLSDDTFIHNLLNKILVNNHIDMMLLRADIARCRPVRNNLLIAETTTRLVEETRVSLVDAANGKRTLVVMTRKNGTAVVNSLRMEKQGAKLLAHRDTVAHLSAHAAAIDDAIVRNVGKTLEHLLVATVAARAQVDSLRVNLNDLTNAVTALHSRDASIFVNDQPISTLVKEKLHA